MTYSATILAEASLAHYYRLDEASGTAAADSKGSLSGTYTNTAGITLAQAGLLTGDTDTCPAFASASAGCVDLGTSIPVFGTTPFSLEAWIRPTNAAGSFQCIVAQFAWNGSHNVGWGLLWDSGAGGNMRWWRVQDNVAPITANGSYGINAVYHVVATYDGATSRLYVNGASVGAAPDTTSMPSNSQALVIGGNAGHGNTFDGKIDEVAFYTAALTGAQVRAHYNAGIQRSVAASAARWHGAYINTGAQGWADSPPQTYPMLDTWNQEAGQPAGAFLKYDGWKVTTAAVSIADWEAVRARGATPMTTWEPWDPAGGTGGVHADQPAYSLQQIAAGAWDSLIDAWAARVAAWGRPLLVRFAHEHNGDWYPWAIRQTATNNNQSDYATVNSAAGYVAAWRRVAQRCRNQGATNALWVWCPATWGAPDDALAITSASYPGDAYVDVVGLDLYNYGTGTGGTWQQGYDRLSLAYDTITAFTQRPWILCEVGCDETGGSKAAWITQFMGTDLATHFPLVRGLMWFEVDQSGSGQKNWRLTSSASAQAAFQVQVAAAGWRAMPPFGAAPGPVAMALAGGLPRGARAGA